MSVVLEVCVDSAEGFEAALAGGADRIELCAALPLGGLTPSAGLMAHAAGRGVPVMAMIRSRAGDFVMSKDDLEIAHDDILATAKAGLNGVVIGASLEDGRLDEPALYELALEARQAGLDVTLHRAFDLVPDVVEAVAVMRRVGIARVLTSGGEETALEGLDRLARTVAAAGTDISVMPGSGVTDRTVHKFLALGVREVHASCSESLRMGGRAVQLGFAPGMMRRTDAARVRALKEAMSAGLSGLT